MSITAQAGIFGFGLNANGLKGGAVATWYRHKAMMVGVAPIKEFDVAPPEISGVNIPTGAFTTGSFYGGRVSIQPRLEDDLGWLLLALAGQSTSAAHATETGVYVHTFSMKDATGVFIPFMGVRRLIPGLTTASDLGEIGTDVVINNLTLNFPQVGPISSDFDFTGLGWSLDDAPDVWTWDAATENYDSVPMVMKGGGLTLPDWTPGGGSPLVATGARVTFINNTTSPQEERIIGSYFPDDFAARQRTMMVEFTYKWADPDLCRLILNGNLAGVPGQSFAEQMTFTDFSLDVWSPNYMDPGTIDYPYKLTITAPKMFWQAQPIQLMGDDLIMMQLVGTAIEPDTGLPEDYYNILLENETVSYPMPT